MAGAIRRVVVGVWVGLWGAGTVVWAGQGGGGNPVVSDPPVQTAPGPSESAAAPVVVERWRESFVVAGDGSVRVDVEQALQIQSTAGVQEYGTVAIPFFRDLDTLEVHYARAVKPDGTVVETPLESAIDVPTPLTQAAPTYTDQVERHINVRGLAVGDRLEVAYTLTEEPMLPGEFTLERELLATEVTRDRELSLSAPESMGLQVQTTLPVETSRADGRVTYRWRIVRDTPLGTREAQALGTEIAHRQFNILATTFSSWAQVGEAMRALWRDRAAVTPVIAAKARELTDGLTTDAEKVAAIYAFVSREVRYVAISFGIGRLRPHAAEDVLENRFGDCKDKHVLLEALLRSVGIESSAVLLGVGPDLDPSVPSPGQFDHVITLVHGADGPVWLDATLEPVLPGTLVVEERARDVLEIPPAGEAHIIRTPADPIRATLLQTRAEAAIDVDGRFTADVKESIAGDPEVMTRQLLRQVPVVSWSEFARRMSMSSLDGTASDVRIEAMEDPSRPIDISYRFTKDVVPGWRDGSIAVPFDGFSLPEVPEDATRQWPLDFGGPFEWARSVRMTLPPGITATVDNRPRAERMELADFAEYHLAIDVSGREVRIERRLVFRARRLAPEHFEAYAAFRKAALAAPPKIKVFQAWPWTSVTRPRMTNPVGKVAEANALVEQAQKVPFRDRGPLLERAVALDPSHPVAWYLLGRYRLDLGQRREGQGAMRHQLDVAPTPDVYKLMAQMSAAEGDAAAAADLYREGMGAFPDDRDFPALLGETLLQLGRNEEAVTVLTAEVARRPQSSRLHSALGAAYLRSGLTSEGIPELEKSIALEAGPNIWNSAAREMSEANVQLEKALEYVDKAIAQTNRENENLTLANVRGVPDAAARLALYLETKGRLLVRTRAFDRAEPFCQAAWDLSYRNHAAECLAQIATARGDARTAERYRRHAIAPYPTGLVPERPIASRPGELTPDVLREVSLERSEHRLRPVERPEGAVGRLALRVLVGPDGRVMDVDASGEGVPSVLRPVVDRLKGLEVGPELPDFATARLVRSAWLECSPDPGPCTLAVQDQGR